METFYFSQIDLIENPVWKEKLPFANKIASAVFAADFDDDDIERRGKELWGLLQEVNKSTPQSLWELQAEAIQLCFKEEISVEEMLEQVAICAWRIVVLSVQGEIELANQTFIGVLHPEAEELKAVSELL